MKDGEVVYSKDPRSEVIEQAPPPAHRQLEQVADNLDAVRLRLEDTSRTVRPHEIDMLRIVVQSIHNDLEAVAVRVRQEHELRDKR